MEPSLTLPYASLKTPCLNPQSPYPGRRITLLQTRSSSRPAAGKVGASSPQLMAGGLADAWQHVVDLYQVYGTLLGFLPPRLGGKSNESSREAWRQRVRYRVTTNLTTS